MPAAKRKPADKTPIKRQHSGNESRVNSLLDKMAEMGSSSPIPRVTFLVLICKILQYKGVIRLPWEKMDVCISAETVLHDKDYKRFIFAVFEHADERDLYYNMVSFMVKGRTLENHYGSFNFALLLLIMIILTNTSYIVMAVIGSKVLHNDALMSYCTIGFSGVVFALKVITTVETGAGKAYIMGLEVPTKYAAWAELVAIRQFVPSTSSLSQAAGILAGCIYIGTHFGLVVDNVIAALTGSLVKDLPYSRTKTPPEEEPNPERVYRTKSRKVKN